MALPLLAVLCSLIVARAADSRLHTGKCSVEGCGEEPLVLLQVRSSSVVFQKEGSTNEENPAAPRDGQQSQQTRTIKVFEASQQYWQPRDFSAMASCSLPCVEASSLADADVVYAATAMTEVTRTSPDQVWVGEFLESPEQWPAQDKDYDYTRSYRADATFHDRAYIPAKLTDMFDDDGRRLRSGSEWPRRVSFAEKFKREKMLSVWISNCGALDLVKRFSVLQTLQEHGVPYASYGGCKHNADVEMELRVMHGRPLDMEKRELELLDGSPRHLFYFAAENSECAYYHTEKVYHALLAGSLPVYLGSTTIDDYVPKGSIIKASDFDHIEDLAEYLKRVASNETLYNSYFEWYNQDLSQTSAPFRAMLLTRKPDLCAECAFHHSHGRNQAPDSKLLGCDV